MNSEDLRESMGAQSSRNHGKKEDNSAKNRSNFHEQLVLLQELERVRQERDELKRQKEQMQRDHLNQTFGKYQSNQGWKWL